jgi:hypothetical protein
MLHSIPKKDVEDVEILNKDLLCYRLSYCRYVTSIILPGFHAFDYDRQWASHAQDISDNVIGRLVIDSFHVLTQIIVRISLSTNLQSNQNLTKYCYLESEAGPWYIPIRLTRYAVGILHCGFCRSP